MSNAEITKARILAEHAKEEQQDAEAVAYAARVRWEQLWLDYLRRVEAAGYCKGCAVDGRLVRGGDCTIEHWQAGAAEQQGDDLSTWASLVVTELRIDTPRGEWDQLDKLEDAIASGRLQFNQSGDSPK